MPKAVFDSTVLISAFLSEAGLSRDLMRQARARAFTICVSEEILKEIESVVRNPNDDMVIACALKAKAHYLITRNKNLLTLESLEQISIFSPEMFMKLLREQHQASSLD